MLYDKSKIRGLVSQVQKTSEPLYIQAYKQLLDHIRSGKIKCGERLPPDMLLSKSLGINHITLGKALKQLETEGYLIRNRGRGTYVVPVLPTPKAPLAGTRISLIYDIADNDAFTGDIFINVHRSVGELGLKLEFLSSGGNRATQFKQIRELFSDPDSAGCILWSILDNQQLGIIEAARPQDYPLVFLDHKPEIEARGFDFVGFDDFAAGKMLGRHLAELGYPRMVCCTQSRFLDFSTDVNRIAGLTAGFGSKPILFTEYSDKRSEPLNEYCRSLNQEHIHIPVVFISEMDLSIFEMIPQKQKSNLTPFVFYTSKNPRCAGIRFPDWQIGRSAVEIIAARRNGDTSFSISNRFPGELIK